MSITDIIRAALFTPAARGRWGLPLLCWAEPGTAKSAIIEEVAAKCGLPCQALSPGTHGEGAFGCVPVPESARLDTEEILAAVSRHLADLIDDGYTPEEAVSSAMQAGLMLRYIGNPQTILKYPPPEWTERMTDGGVVFVDEITTCPPALQPPLLGLALNAMIGFHYLGDRVRVIAAANPPEMAAGGYDLSPPVANRFGHIQWTAPSIDDHAAYMMGAQAMTSSITSAKVDAKQEEERVAAAWPHALAKAVGLEVAFLRRKPSLKNQCPKTGTGAARAWPSDRTWEMATRALASAEVHGLEPVDAESFVAAFIGQGTANELFMFRDQVDLPDPGCAMGHPDQLIEEQELTGSARTLDEGTH
jgi:MoxR-like ATPase